ncbi:sugar translocase [Bacillus sp. SA1-12]|uniref:GtrA family protein n=1 Tax=Bacillus sp. SA1-12 TaxID=1455638 RepID=UPI000626DDF0|nr:GtrA family protein [Bacillus sp. SA1-12]KKI93166.1 sugar translocase [Bacillus sp. SA1-12]
MKRFLKFGTVGIFNTLITIGSYSLFVMLGMDYIFANLLAYSLGVMNSYYWNKNWVFEAGAGRHNDLFLRFVLVNLITLCLNTFVLYLLVDHIAVQPLLAQVFATGCGLVVNYVLNQRWTFSG